MDISDMPHIHHGEEVPLNTTCLVWRHARWFVARENEKIGYMFPLKSTKQCQVSEYENREWGYARVIKVAKNAEVAINWMEEQIK